MAFEGFDLGIRDRYENCLCVGDNIKEFLFIDGQRIEHKGQIVYSPKMFCFAVRWTDYGIYPLHNLEDDFWEGVEKCQK
jgi:hypothetical protein